jgi:TRAP-type C4-dicarboxylate transport system permease large subunit
MTLIAMVAKRRNFPVEPPIPLRELPRLTLETFPALLMPVILLVCLYSGATTPTEAAAAAAMYSLAVSALLYRSMSLRDAYNALLTSARVTASIGMLIAGAMVFNYVITVENIPKALAATLKAAELSPFMFLLFANILLLLLGCVLEGTTILLIFVRCSCPPRCARHRPGALRRDGGRQRHDRAVLAAVRPAAPDDGQDHGVPLRTS